MVPTMRGIRYPIKTFNPRDAIVKIRQQRFRSDLHLYDGYIPTMEKGDIPG